MFKTISWEEYFYTSITIIGAYYAISILLLYSEEIIQKFGRLGNKSSKSEKGSTLGLSNNLMGIVRSDQHIQRTNTHQNIVPAEEISIASDEVRNSEDLASLDRLLIGTVSDLLHEIETLSKIISDNAGTKEDSIPMFQTLLSNYSQLSGTHYQEAIDRVIYDQCRSVCTFDVELTEIKSWWPLVETQKVN